MANSPSSAQPILDEAALALKIRKSRSSDVAHTKLQTDERVIARVTDGIYRQPGSAIRELISNAFDADATKVVIKTDRPRFREITISDNGNGMSPEMLAHMFLHIGGSAKRNKAGSDLGITDSNNSQLSPQGRRLIGKIGIGLFSVSQLTHRFEIFTKTTNDSFRTVASVALRQFSEDDVKDSTDELYEAGQVNIWREKAQNTKSHGTTIVLTSIRPQARDTLRSREIWSVIEQLDQQLDSDDDREISPPLYHIGRVDSSSILLERKGGSPISLPWNKTDNPDTAFRALVDSVWRLAQPSAVNPRLDAIFDYYLRMIWQLSLAAPLPYVDIHPFDLQIGDDLSAFLLSNEPGGSATQLQPGKGSTIREVLGLNDGVGTSTASFEVIVDDVKLARPIRYRGLPSTQNALKEPLMFVGKCREDFSKVPIELSGGPLAFEAYLFWTPKVAPTEHQGALVRIHGSSGTLFDSTFMRYQVSEQTRLRQIVCEIFVTTGLDSALNIDRESFNGAHPHAVYITKWLHNALRQLASTQKRLAGQIRSKSRAAENEEKLSEIKQVALRTWRRERDDPGETLPEVTLVDRSDKPSSAIGHSLVLRVGDLGPTRASRNTPRAINKQGIWEEKLKAVFVVLASYGLLDNLGSKKIDTLASALFKIISSADE